MRLIMTSRRLLRKPNRIMSISAPKLAQGLEIAAIGLDQLRLRLLKAPQLQRLRINNLPLMILNSMLLATLYKALTDNS